MAKLSDEEQAKLDELQKKRDAPDEPAPRAGVQVHVDLSDEAAVERAIKLGLLTEAEVEADRKKAEDGDPDDDEPDDAPTGRKRSLSDRWAS